MSVKVTKDLIRGSSDPSTIQTYKTKGYTHEGVSGSEPIGRLSEAKVGKAITPQVMTENNLGVKKIVKDGVTSRGLGDGMPANAGRFKK